MADPETCLVCGGDWRPLHRTVASQWPLRRCANCGLQSLWPQPGDEVLAAIYGQDYFKSWGMSQGQEPDYLRKMKRATFGRQLKLLGAEIRNGSILDVGCATGLFMETAKAAGYEVSGLDISEFAVRIARAKFGEEAIFLGELSQLATMGRTFDAITMSDFIEHVRDPLAAFEAAGKLLRPGGCLLIQTPDAASTSARWMGARWSHYKLEHLWYFTPAAIGALADKAGFHTLRIQAAKKALNLSYVHQQFKAYRHPLLSPLTRLLHALTLPPLRKANMVLPAGELIALFQKPK